MNETLKVLENRRSVRAYSDDPITEHEKETILHGAYRAPTAGNMMLYSIIEVEDQALKDRLAVTCDDQPFIAQAPYVLIFLADYQRWWDYFTHCGAQKKGKSLGLPIRKPQTGDLLLACNDALIAAQNAVITAESMGIGSCYIGDILERYETHRELLNLPQYVLPITMLCFGRPKKAYDSPSKVNRLDREFTTFKNGYQRLSSEQLDRIFRDREERIFSPGSNPIPDAENFGQLMYLRKFNSDFGREMTRSVEEMLKNWH
jgi:FMN reductase (NADPH)/FMN reductase [NAD(P)H]